ncbi:DUF1850 domain-containing protein [[Pasteurella] aerogenes]|nr:DUF1850 domain-containing protein [[Pasteurella] aerogenes]MDY4480527.1 DUF1850 domain-containing protein [[Pasteurella] aerogenes]VEG72874.1 putative transmembrane protein [[Pasteurella] aerogenes]
MKITPRNGWFVLLALLAVIGLYPVHFISVTTKQGECIIDDDHFALRWRHSVEHQLWYEHYQRQGDNLHLYQTWLQTFGAGTPSQGEIVADVPPGYVGFKQDIVLSEINWIVSRRMEGAILLNDKQFPVYQILPDYSTVTIKPAQSVVATLWLRKSCYD